MASMSAEEAKGLGMRTCQMSERRKVERLVPRAQGSSVGTNDERDGPGPCHAIVTAPA
jgi:hypothetical protein